MLYRYCLKSWHHKSGEKSKHFSYPNFLLIQTLGLLELAKGVRIIEVGLYNIIGMDTRGHVV